MRRTRHPFLKQEAKFTLALAPMLDVIFLLLLYFVVTFHPVSTEGHTAMKLPGINPTPGPRRPDIVQLGVLPGQYLVHNQPCSLAKVAAYLASAAVSEPDARVSIKVSPEATEGELVAILDLCQKTRLTNLSVMT
jgi:biopolymer transport protein ExbD